MCATASRSPPVKRGSSGAACSNKSWNSMANNLHKYRKFYGGNVHQYHSLQGQVNRIHFRVMLYGALPTFGAFGSHLTIVAAERRRRRENISLCLRRSVARALLGFGNSFRCSYGLQ